MATKQYLEAVRAVEAWCEKNKIKLISKPRHVFARAYVVGQAAPQCLVVAQCWADKERYPKVMDSLFGRRQNGLNNVHLFDKSLQAGDWCITAYISTSGCGQPVAIPIPEAI
jgi:hypothetical protein